MVTFSNKIRSSLKGFTKIQKRLKWIIFLFLISGIVVILFASLLLIFPLLSPKWHYQYPLIILFIGISLLLLALLLITVAYRANRRDSKRGEGIKRQYLKHIIAELEYLRLIGVPEGLTTPGVKLDEVFIPLQYRISQPLSNYPLIEEEVRRFRDRLKAVGLYDEKGDTFYEDEEIWQDILKKNERIHIIDLWQKMTRGHPAIVIQGAPGTGKTFLVSRIALHLARSGLGLADHTIPSNLTSELIPIFLRLGNFAIECQKTPNMSLMDYLLLALSRLEIPGLGQFILERLKAGQCVILLDGLDEIFHQQTQKQVQEAIQNFILEKYSTTETGSNFNRFLLTSRILGYNRTTFSNYEHYIIAELTDEQIEDFITRWYRATTRMPSSDHLAMTEKEAARITQKLLAAIKHRQGIHDLAENPLFLRLLVLMQQNRIELPSYRGELYSVITRTLLESRAITKDLPPIPERQAIQLLGPLAFDLQQTGKSFASKTEILVSLKRSPYRNDASLDNWEQEMVKLLNRVQERGGLLVEQSLDNFCFFHRAFQEYFAARYILDQIKRNPGIWIGEFVKMVNSSSELWQEVFLLAVSYESGEDEVAACEIILNLLKVSQQAYPLNQTLNQLIAAESIIEAKPLTIRPTLEKRVAEQLLLDYNRSLEKKQREVCDEIETIVRRWLLSIPQESYRSPLLSILSETISDRSDLSLQYSTLKLLSMIAEKLTDGPSIVFDTLTPPLLALVGQPNQNRYKLPVPKARNRTIDLALTTLSCLKLSESAGL